MSNLELRVSGTMSSSTCSHQADFCCHAATQSHSIILRSIKRCGYPGRRESCLSFQSHIFFPPVFCLCRPLTPRPPALCDSPVSCTTPSSPLLCILHPLSPLRPVLFSPPRIPSSDDVGSQYQGISIAVCQLPSLIYLSIPSFSFLWRED